MRKYLSLFIFALLLPLKSMAAGVEQWVEGTHYVVVGEEATAKPEVLEFFSYWCSHCYNFEPIVANLEKKLPEDVKFNKVHVNFMAFTTSEIQEDATRGLMIARALKKEKEMNRAIFNYIHVQRAPIAGIDDIRNIFTVNGVDAAEFDKLANSFGVNSQLKKNNQSIQKFMKHLRGVPNFIVNGKYQAKFTRDMTPDDMVDLIVWLTKLK